MVNTKALSVWVCLIYAIFGVHSVVVAEPAEFAAAP
jgi:hypothetical protein